MQKLWNRPDAAVWSLSTQSAQGVGNMNICTYVTAVSLKPKLMLVAVYKNTQTIENVSVGTSVLLQLLTEDLAPVVRICGQQSGKTIDKITRLQKRYQFKMVHGLHYFADVAGWIELLVEELVDTSGDHMLLIGKVLQSKNVVDASILTTAHLKQKGYIR